MPIARVGNVGFFDAPPFDDMDGFIGYGIARDGITGWWGRPDSSGDQIQRPGAHGEFDLAAYMSGRIVTISGFVAGPNSRWRELTTKLAGLGADGERLKVEVADDGETTWAFCRVVGVNIKRSSSASRPTFMVTLRCPNPRRFGETHPLTDSNGVLESGFVSTGANVSAYHRGNFDAIPRFRVTGNYPGGYRLRGRGRIFVVTIGLAPGVVDLVDYEAGTVTRDGVVLTRSMATSSRFSVPGGPLIPWRVEPVTTGSGQAEMFLRDTFV